MSKKINQFLGGWFSQGTMGVIKTSIKCVICKRVMYPRKEIEIWGGV